MLILTRKPGESVYIGDDVKITIVEIKGHQIRVGIDAPRDLRIYREEIYEQIREENRQAAVSSTALESGLEGLGSGWGKGGSGEKKGSGLQKLSSFKMKASSDEGTPSGSNGDGNGDDTPPSGAGASASPQVVVRRKKRK